MPCDSEAGGGGALAGKRVFEVSFPSIVEEGSGCEGAVEEAAREARAEEEVTLGMADAASKPGSNPEAAS